MKSLFNQVRRLTLPAAMGPENYVGALYRNVLGREPDPDGLANYSNFIRTGGDPTLVLKNLLECDEGARRQKPPAMSPETYVGALYRNVLGREPDPDGLANYSNFIRTGGDPTLVLKNLLECDEGARRQKPPAMSPENYVREVYRHTLGRMPDADGLKTYTQLIRTGGDPTIVLRDLITCCEYADRRTLGHWPPWCQVYNADSGEIIDAFSVPAVASPTYFDSRVLRHDQSVRYDLEEALALTKATSLTLVFFMGLGDYLMTTPFLKTLREKFPHLQINAAVSSSSDSNNSPLVADLLKVDPHVDKVIIFNGKQARHDWRHYDYRELQQLVAPDSLVVPLIYRYSRNIRHRSHALHELFSLPHPTTIDPPLIHTSELNLPVVEKEADTICDAMRRNGRQRLVFFHGEHRSSKYTYKYSAELLRLLAASGYYVFSLDEPPTTSNSDACSESVYFFDKHRFSASQLLHLARTLVARLPGTSSITTPSMFANVVAGLGISNITLHHRFDEAAHNYHYPNLLFLSWCDYPSISSDNLLLAPPQMCHFDANGHCHYHPDYVLHSFQARLQA